MINLDELMSNPHNFKARKGNTKDFNIYVYDLDGLTSLVLKNLIYRLSDKQRNVTVYLIGDYTLQTNDVHIGTFNQATDVEKDGRLTFLERFAHLFPNIRFELVIEQQDLVYDTNKHCVILDLRNTQTIKDMTQRFVMGSDRLNAIDSKTFSNTTGVIRYEKDTQRITLDVFGLSRWGATHNLPNTKVDEITQESVVYNNLLAVTIVALINNMITEGRELNTSEMRVDATQQHIVEKSAPPVNGNKTKKPTLIEDESIFEGLSI